MHTQPKKTPNQTQQQKIISRMRVFAAGGPSRPYQASSLQRASRMRVVEGASYRYVAVRAQAKGPSTRRAEIQNGGATSSQQQRAPASARAIASSSSSSSSKSLLDRTSSSSTTISSTTSGRAQNAGARVAGAAAAALCAAALALAPLPAPLAGGAGGQALAADVAKVGTCLLSRCQAALAKCLADGPCLQNLVCLNLCNGAPDETACQIKCGDQYGDAAVDAFNACAISDQKCVPQRPDEGLFPVPPESALDTSFDLSGFVGTWYITAGLNPLFDTFDCQAHSFVNPAPGRMTAQINWRIARPDGDFMERSTIQNFVQQPDQPAVLLNHGNEYLHYG